MSSWKQYGGTNKGEKANDINADSIVANYLSLKKPYQGNLIVNGGLQINKDLLISGNTQMIGNTVFDNIIVNGLSIFEGIATLNSTFSILGNIDSQSNVNVANNIVCGNVLYFNNDSQFIYADPSGIGINKINPDAALDISTNLINGISIQSSQPISTSTLIQNCSGQGILLYGNTTTEYIDFFNETSLSSQSVGDARLSYTKGGIFELDVSQNINLMSNITVSNRGSQPHLFNETVIIYDTSNGPFFGNIYSQSINTGSALTLVSANNTSNTFLHISTPSGEGIAIGGGVYSNDTTRSSGFIGLTDSSGQLITTQNIVSGSDPVKYRSTIGINTFQPQTEKYVVDINGPIHINNSDITTIDQKIPFELYSMSISNNNRNKIIALGSSYDITIQSGFQKYREKIIISNDYGSTWSQIDISNGLLNLKIDPKFTNIYTYDNSYAFISGINNTLFFSIDGGYNWNNIVTNIINQSFYNIQIGNSNIAGNKILYFSSGNILYYYDFSFNNLPIGTYSITVSNIVTSLVNINAITTNSNSIFIAGSRILKYNISNLNIIDNSHNNTSNISYNEIHSFNDTIIAVGKDIISSSRNNGSSWTDIYMNGIQFNSIFCNDASNAIAVGNKGNLWASQDGGITWTLLPDSLLNTSGKKWMITDTSNILQNVVMSDSNTIIVSNILTPYIQGSQYGSSELINIFIPNFINRSNNNIFDVCGNMQISGDIRINDGGSLQSNNNTFSMFDESVQTITIGSNSNSIIIGGIPTGITEMQHNIIVDGNTVLKKNLNVFYDTSLNGNLIVGKNMVINGTATFISDSSFHSNVVLGRNLTIQGNVIGLYDTSFNGNLIVGKNMVINGNSTFISDSLFHSNLQVGNNLTIQGNLVGIYDTSLNGNLTVGKNMVINGTSTFISDSSFISNVVLGRNLTIQGNIIGLYDTELNGNLSVSGYSNINSDISIGGNATINKNLSVIEYSNFKSDVSMNGNLIINQNMMVYGNILGLYDTELNGNLLVKNATINGNLTVISNLNLTGNLEMSHDSTFFTTYILPNDDGILTIGDNYDSTTSQIYIGGPHDNIIFQGQVVYELPAINNTPFIVVNANATGYATSGGCGINIYDNSGEPSPYDPLTDAGYIHIGHDLQSFVFKAPNINKFGNQISGNNIVRLGVNSLTLQNPNIVNGLVVLQKDQTYHNNQEANGTSFGGYRPNESDYAIVSANLDISNIMLKQIDSITGSQVLETNLIIGNTNINNKLSVYGNLDINGTSNFVSDSSFHSNLIVGNNLTIQGNIIGLYDTSLNGNLVVGTNMVVNRTSTFVSDSSFHSNLQVGKNLTIQGNLVGIYDTSLNGNLTVGKNIVINGSSTFISDSSFISNVILGRNLTIQGNIIGLYDTSLNGNLTLDKNMVINGTSTFISDSSFNANVVVGRNLTIQGNVIGLYDISLNGNLTLDKNMVINGTSNFISDSSFNANVVVGRNLTIQGNLIGIYDTSLNGNLTVGKNMVINGTSTFVSDSSFNSNVVLGRNLTIQGNVIGLYDASLNGNLTLGKNMVINGTSTFVSDSSFNSNVVLGRNLTIQGSLIGLYDTSFNGNLIVGKNMVINGNSTFISDSSFNANVVVGRNLTIRGNINALYDSSLNGNLIVGKNMVINGNSTFISDSSFNGNINIGGNINIYSSVNSINSTTGALIVNGGGGFGGDVWINGSIYANNIGTNNIGTNNVSYWNSQSLGITSFPTNTYYLLATMGDFSNSYGSININGSIGGQNGTNMATINTTIVTSGTTFTPSIIGSIKNYNSVQSPLCDIVIYYDNSSNNYQPTNVKITDISGFILDASHIYYNTSNTFIDVDQDISGSGINSIPTIINSFDNSNNFSINTIQNNLTRPAVDISSIGLIFTGNTFIIQNKNIPTGYFLDSSSINTYSKPFISSTNNYTYTTPNINLLTVTDSINATGFIQNRTIPGIAGNSYLITTIASLDNKILYGSTSPNDISNAPIINSYSNIGNASYTYKLLLSNGSASIQNTSTNTSFYGYINSSNKIITNNNGLSYNTSNYITDNSYGTGIPDGTRFDGTVVSNTNNYAYGTVPTNGGTLPTPGFINISGGIHKMGSNYYFTYTTTDPGVNNFISTSDASYNIPDLSCIFLSSKVSGGNNYIITPNVNMISDAKLNSTSRFGVSGESVPYYIVDASTIALPLTNSVYQNFNITGTVPDDIVTFGNVNTGNVYDGLTTYNADYLADASNCRHYINVNTTNLISDASDGYATIATGSNYTSGTNIILSASGGIIKVGQFISIPSISAYTKSSIRVKSWVNSTITLDSSLNTIGYSNAKIYFYNQTTNLNIIKPSTFKINTGYQLYNFPTNSYSAYNPVTFNFYQPKNYSLYSLRDLSDGVNPGPQYKIYLLTNKNGSNPNGYFNLAITGGDNSSNIMYPSTDVSSSIPNSNIVINSVCDTLTNLNNTFQTQFNTISTISTSDLSSNSTTNIITPILSTYDGSNIQIAVDSSMGSVTISDPNLISGSSIQVTIQCSTNQVGANNNLYFGIGYSSTNLLYTSLPLSLVSTNYIANIMIPTNQQGYINLYIFANSVSSGILNTMYIQSLSISKLDVYTYGQVGIGKNNPQYSLDVNGAVQATSYNALSDYRIKENIIPISDTDFSIDPLKPVYYSMKGSQKKDLGFLAHEVQENLPFLVSGEKDGKDMQSINYNGFIALLVKEIQDLKSEMKVLKERVGELEKGSEIDLS